MRLTLYQQLGFFTLFLSSADFFQYQHFSFRNTSRVSNRLDPDQARHFVGHDLGPNCLKRFSADDTSRQCVKLLSSVGWHVFGTSNV